MKKTLVLLIAAMFTATSGFAATQTLGQWADQTSKKINAKEAALTKKVTDRQDAYKKQQAEAQAKRDAQAKNYQKQKEQYQKDVKARQDAQKAKQDAAKKRLETKKQQWNQLINN